MHACLIPSMFNLQFFLFFKYSTILVNKYLYIVGLQLLDYAPRMPSAYSTRTLWPLFYAGVNFIIDFGKSSNLKSTLRLGCAYTSGAQGFGLLQQENAQLRTKLVSSQHRKCTIED
jgi:hypothetical protein